MCLRKTSLFTQRIHSFIQREALALTLGSSICMAQWKKR